jgi:hypothetical protein
MRDHSTLNLAAGQSASPEVAAHMRGRLSIFLDLFLENLDREIDKRLVRTFAKTVEAILTFRNRNHGLLLSELGGYIDTPGHAPAGTKRISNLLACAKWKAERIVSFLWGEGERRRWALLDAEETPIVLWDDSVNEKPESTKAQGLGPVRSSKAKRLTRIKPGYYRPPGRRIFVPGFHWFTLLILGRKGPPTVAAMEWWTTRETEGGPTPTDSGAIRRKPGDGRCCTSSTGGMPGLPGCRSCWGRRCGS